MIEQAVSWSKCVFRFELRATYAIFGLRFGVRHEQQSAGLVVSLLAGQVKRRKLGLLIRVLIG